MAATNTERALVDLCADLLELEPGKTIFRGNLPAAKTDVVSVLIDTSARGNGPAMPRYNVQLLGRFASRDFALELCDRMDRKFPHAGSGFYILKTGKPGVYQSTHKGKEVSGISLNLDVRLTKQQ